MTDANDETRESNDADDGLYRIAAPEQRAEPTPTRKRRRRKRPETDDRKSADHAPSEPPDAPWQTDERVLNWTGDSGWREPPVVSAIWYPFTGNGWRLVPILAFIVWLARMVPIPIVDIIFLLLTLSLVSVLLLESANYVLEEVPGGPQTPDWLSWSTISVGLTGLVAFFLSGIPLIVGLIAMTEMGEINPYITLLLLGASMFYVPMAFLALAERQNESALNPLVVFDGIRKMLLPYLAAWFVAAAVFIVPTMLFLALGAHWLLRDLVLNFLLIYTGTALMRAIALLAKKHGVSLAEPEDDEEEEEEAASPSIGE